MKTGQKATKKNHQVFLNKYAKFQNIVYYLYLD